MCALRVVLADSETADLVKQTAAGTLVMTRVEFLVRFSGFKDETATIVITVTALDNGGRLSLIEGSNEASSRKLQLGQVIKVEGVRSGERIVRYVGFLVDETVSGAPQKNGRGAALTYELSH
jgi:hypothetical protein